MFRTTRTRFLVAGTVGLAAAALPMTAFAGTAGAGSVTTVVAATTVPGLLTLTGAGVSVTPSQTPGAFSGASVGTTALSVADLTGTTHGWAVTATYSDPAAALITAGQIPLGGSNVQVNSSGVTGDAAGVAAPIAYTPLTTPVTVLTTGAAGGSGVTLASSDMEVRIPATATTGQVYGGTVTYTVASVR